MSAPVWVLSVDLQTKTATFTTGLADAAQKARSSLGDIRDSAKDMGTGFSQSGVNVRAAIGLIDNTIRGAHNAAMADLIREFQNTNIVMAALPYAVWIGGIAAVIGLAVEVAEKVKEYREEQQKLKDSQTEFGTAANDAFRGLDDRILQAEKRTDELRNDHIGALNKELQLIDHASMDDLVKTLGTLAKAADETFSHMQSHWYTFGIGSSGAKHALDEFKIQYESLASKGDEGGASNLLKGTLERAQQVLALQKAAQSNDEGMHGVVHGEDPQKLIALHKAALDLQQYCVGYTEKEVQAQEALVSALQDQVTAEGKIAALKGLDSGNARTQTSNEAAARASEAAKQAATAQQAIAEAKLAADRSMAGAQLELANATVAQRLESDLAFAQKELDIQLTGNQAQIAALNRTGADYNNQLAALHEKAEELTAQHSAKVVELTARTQVEARSRAVAELDATQREQIAATEEGSTARITAIEEALQVQYALGLQDTEYARSLGQQKVEAVRRAAQEENRARAEAGREAADNNAKLAELALAADEAQQQFLNSSRRVTDDERIAQEINFANRAFAIKLAASIQEQAALDASGKDYDNKLQSLQNRELQLIRQHENEVAAIKQQAQAQQNERMKQGLVQMENGFAQSFLSVLEGHRSFAQMMDSISQQIVSNTIAAAIQEQAGQESTKLTDAKTAARKMYLAGTHFPFPTNIVMAPVLGAAAFAAMMAFNSGTDGVPGVGNTDVVPAMLTPGEGVVPGGVMDGLRNVARNGGFDQKPNMTVHAHFAPQIQAIDAQGVDRMLMKHQKLFRIHLESAVRRTNR